jgi:hypothetical protein
MKRIMSLHAVSSRALSANHLDLRIPLVQGHFVLQGWMQYIRVTCYCGRSGTHEPLAPMFLRRINFPIQDDPSNNSSMASAS